MFVMPGQLLDVGESTKLGPGIIFQEDGIISARAGLLRSEGNKLWVQSAQKRYVPQLNESVVGTVMSRFSEGYKIDIGAASYASLDSLAFAGASKRNRPHLEIGMLIYCRVSVANRDMDPEVECMAQDETAQGYGELKEGYVVKVSLELARSLLNRDHIILSGFAQLFPFETAIGHNGLVWVNAAKTSEVIAIMNVIKSADTTTASKLPKLIRFYKDQLNDAMNES